MLRQGRLFDERDTPQARNVVLVNETIVRLYFANQDPVGQTLDVGRTLQVARRVIRIISCIRRSVRVSPLRIIADPQWICPHLNGDRMARRGLARWGARQAGGIEADNGSQRRGCCRPRGRRSGDE
jgi:hypothetical protein